VFLQAIIAEGLQELKDGGGAGPRPKGPAVGARSRDSSGVAAAMEKEVRGATGRESLDSGEGGLVQPLRQCHQDDVGLHGPLAVGPLKASPPRGEEVIQTARVEALSRALTSYAEHGR